MLKPDTMHVEPGALRAFVNEVSPDTQHQVAIHSHLTSSAWLTKPGYAGRHFGRCQVRSMHCLIALTLTAQYACSMSLDSLVHHLQA